MSPDDVIDQILQKRPDIERQQILNRLAVAKDMTGGLIAEASLLRMIAAELGVDVANEDGTFNHRLSLGHLVTGLNNATVTGRIVAVYPVKTFEGAKPGKFASVTIVDNDGVLRVILWNEKAEFVESGKLQVGQIVKFAHGYTKADRFGVAELHLGDRSQVDLNPTNVTQADYPSISKFAIKINQLTIDQKSVNLEATIKDVFSASTFTRSDQTAGKVLRLKVVDETGEVPLVLWNEKAEEFEPKLKRGMQVQLVNGKVKPSQNGELEVHVDFASYLNATEPPKRIVKVADLGEEFGDVCVQGTVASLPVTKEVKTGKGELVKLASFDLKDDSGSIRVTAWREHAETVKNLFMGEKVLLENVYPKVGYNGKLELSTRTASIITKV
jgi:replication factor A1